MDYASVILGMFVGAFAIAILALVFSLICKRPMTDSLFNASVSAHVVRFRSQIVPKVRATGSSFWMISPLIEAKCAEKAAFISIFLLSIVIFAELSLFGAYSASNSFSSPFRTGHGECERSFRPWQLSHCIIYRDAITASELINNASVTLLFHRFEV